MNRIFTGCWEGIDEPTTQLNHVEHCNMDKLVERAVMARPGKIRTAIVRPALIHCQGRVPDSQCSSKYKRPQVDLRYQRIFTAPWGNKLRICAHKAYTQDLPEFYWMLDEAEA